MEYMIEVKGLCKNYPGFSLKNISFKLPGGCIMGLVGENGAGKSTTIKIIMDLVHKDSGEVSVLGGDMQTDGRRLRSDIGVVLDGAGFHEALRTGEIETFMKRIYKNWDSAYYHELLQKFSLSSDKPVKEFSTGMRMKLMITAAMAHRPKLLILDEATSGLDPVVRDEILDMLLAFIQDEEHSVLISSHITSDLEKVADYITFIHRGEVFMSEEKDRIMEEYAVIHCRSEDVEQMDKKYIAGIQRGTYGCDVLVNNRTAVRQKYPDLLMDAVKLEDILMFKVKGEK